MYANAQYSVVSGLNAFYDGFLAISGLVQLTFAMSV